MTMQTNAQNTYAAIGIREDLTDLVALIDPQETPMISNIGTSPPAKQTVHEWQVQTLATPSKANAQLEGDDNVSAAAAVARQRLKNVCTISKKIGSVTGTMGAVIVAGIANELDNQKMLKGVELRRDMEVMLADNVAYQTGGTTTARQAAGLAAYVTNTDMTGCDLFSAATGTGVDKWNLSSSTTRNLSLSIMNGSIQAAYITGGKPNLFLCSPKQKTAFSNLTLNSSLGGAAQIRYNMNEIKAGALIGSVDTWLSNFGQVDVAVDVQFASDSGTSKGLDQIIYLVDTRHAGVSYLRPMFTEDLAKTGDANKFEVVCEYTLQVDAPKAHAALLALT